MSEIAFRQGDRVGFRIGARTVEGIVKEDRGPIGVHGRILYRVEFVPEEQSDERSIIELPADQMQSVRSLTSTK